MLAPTEELLLMIHQARAAWIHHVLAPEILQALARCEKMVCLHDTSYKLVTYYGRRFCARCGEYVTC